MKKYFCLSIVILVFHNTSYCQYKPFTKEPADSCTIITEKKISNNRQSFSCRHLCKGDSYYAELEDINDKGDYFRSGVSVWYYDDHFTKVRKRSTYWRGDEYGMVQEFYENGLIKAEGICKSIRYFRKYLEGGVSTNLWCRVDLMDTTFFADRGKETVDSLVALDKYRYVDSVLYKPYNKPKGTIYIPSPQPQKFGEWKYYDEMGKLLRREYYIKGVLSKTITY
jgi:antitoxin component YwqK of YwqJK toxin-antitoxin module